MTVTKDSFDIFSEDNIPSSNWMKFNSIWDAVKGTFKEKFEKQWDGVMPDQIVFVLDKAVKQKLKIENDKPAGVISAEEPTTINVGVKKTNSFILERLKNVKPWDILAFAFIKEIAPKQKGYNPAKSIMPYKGWVDEEWLKENGQDIITEEDLPF